MNRKDYILFNLDGTLTDPKEGITKLVQHALAYFGIQTDDLDSLMPFIEPPSRDSFEKYYGFSDKQAWEGVQAYREYFSVRGWAQNKECPGIKEIPEALKEAGRVLLMTISKSEKFVRKILEHSDMADCFDFIGGADMGETRMRRGDVIRYVLERCGLEPDDETIGRHVVVEDRERDVLGAREYDTKCVGVFYRYGDHQEVNGCRPVRIVETVKELRDSLLSL